MAIANHLMDWNTKLYSEKHAFVHDFGVSLVHQLNAQPEERILDLGSGTGELTFKIAKSAKKVIGIDKSAEMVESARRRFPQIEFLVGDACDIHFDEPFDAIFSNAVLHWVVDYRKAIRNSYDNLKEGGRIVLEFGGKDNVKTITDSLRKVLRGKGYERQSNLELWYFPSIGEYTPELESAGFKVTFAHWYDRPTELADGNTGIRDWLSMFAKPFFKGVGASDVRQIMNEVEETLRPILFRNGNWYADYKRIRVVAKKEKVKHKINPRLPLPFGEGAGERGL